jgi:hypothetical protein
MNGSLIKKKALRDLQNTYQYSKALYALKTSGNGTKEIAASSMCFVIFI